MNKNTKAYKNKINYISKYKKDNCKRFLLEFHKVNDADIINQIMNQPNKNEYIRKLVLKDIEK